MTLEENIKEWVKLDNKQADLNNELKIIRNKKVEYSNHIINYFEEKDINNPTINITGGKINMIDLKTANPLSYKFLEDCFNEFFKDYENNLAEELLNYIKTKRTYSNNKNLKRINLMQQ